MLMQEDDSNVDTVPSLDLPSPRTPLYSASSSAVRPALSTSSACAAAAMHHTEETHRLKCRFWMAYTGEDVMMRAGEDVSSEVVCKLSHGTIVLQVGEEKIMQRTQQSWEHKNDADEWVLSASADAVKLESAWRMDPKACHLLRLGPHQLQYNVDFQAMTQRNLKTGRTRGIRIVGDGVVRIQVSAMLLSGSMIRGWVTKTEVGAVCIQNRSGEFDTEVVITQCRGESSSQSLVAQSVTHRLAKVANDPDECSAAESNQKEGSGFSKEKEEKEEKNEVEEEEEEEEDVRVEDVQVGKSEFILWVVNPDNDATVRMEENVHSKVIYKLRPGTMVVQIGDEKVIDRGIIRMKVDFVEPSGSMTRGWVTRTAAAIGGPALFRQVQEHEVVHLFHAG